MIFRKVQLSKHSTVLIIRFLKLVIFAEAILVVLLFAVINTIPVNDLSSPVTNNILVEKKILKPGLPKKLLIESIGIAVDIDYVGLTPDGEMDISPNPQSVVWYMLGPRPGERGSAVVAGHYGWTANGESAIFNSIQKLKKGDELSIIDQHGQIIVFIVRESREYRPESDATFVFKSNDGKSHLNLITCSGVWENDNQSYSNRLVVFTDMKEAN